MPYSPGIQFDPAGSARAGAQLVSPLEEALQKYDAERKKSQFNQGVFDIMKDKTDSSGKPYIPVEAIARWDSLNPDKQAGYLAAAGASLKEDMARKAQERQDQLAAAQANLAQAKAFSEWTGQGEGSTFNPTPEKIAEMKSIGKVWAPMGNKTGTWAEDPNNPANMGVAPPTPIMDPRDPNKIIGLQDAKGGIKYFPRPTSTEEFANFMAMQKGGATAPPAAPKPASTPAAAAGIVTVQSPAEAQALAPGTRYKTPDGRTFIR